MWATNFAAGGKIIVLIFVIRTITWRYLKAENRA
jgi:hypothetical protein